MPTKTIQKKDVEDLEKIIEKLNEVCPATKECNLYKIIGCYACPFTIKNGNCGIRIGMGKLRDIGIGLNVRM